MLSFLQCPFDKSSLVNLRAPLTQAVKSNTSKWFDVQIFIDIEREIDFCKLPNIFITFTMKVSFNILNELCMEAKFKSILQWIASSNSIFMYLS